MPKWSDIVNSAEYKASSVRERQRIKSEFYDNVIAKSPRFQSLPQEERGRITFEFSKNKASEGLGLKDAWQETPIAKGLAAGDKAIEGVATAIEGKMPAGRSNFDLAVKDFPRYMAAEFLRGYKPSTVIPFYLGMKGVGKVAPAVTSIIAKKTPQSVKDKISPITEYLTKNLTVGKGAPKPYLDAKDLAELDRAAGQREAEAVAKTLTTAPKDMQILTDNGMKTLKKGQPLTIDQQRYMGRLFRNEIDLTGHRPLIDLKNDVELSNRILKNVEVEVAFNQPLQQLQNELHLVNKQLRSPKLKAESQVGKVFRNAGGAIEEATGVNSEKVVNELGKQKTVYNVISEPISPVEGANVPKSIFPENDIERAAKQVAKADVISKAPAFEQKILLARRKELAKKIQNKIMDIETRVRANYQLFDKKYVDQISNNPKYKDLKKISDEGRVVMDKWSKELINTGLAEGDLKDIIEQNVGKYMARMYETKLAKTGTAALSSKPLRLRLDGLKKRKDLSADVLSKLKEIKEPALPTTVRVREISTSVANKKLFDLVASNREWVSDVNLTGKMIEMPKSKSMGKLAGKWVIPEIGEDINAIYTAKKAAENWYTKSIGAFKFGKVVANPATHMRNIMTNTLLLDLSGVNHFRQMQLLPRVIKSYLTKDELYQSALKNGAIGGEFVGTEIQKIRDFYLKTMGNHTNRLMNLMKIPFESASNIYKGEEQLFKLIKFTDMIERGATPLEAAKEAQKWLFDYNKIPKIIETAKYLNPFITFTYKSVPRVAEALVSNPMRVYKYYALFNGFNEASRKIQGMSPDEYARQIDALPPWLLRNAGGMPANLLLPYKDKYNRTQWFNLEYILPLGAAPEIFGEDLLGGAITNPFMTLFADLVKNRDFKGQEIVPVGATKEEASKAIANHIYRTLAPSLSPALGEDFKGGYSWEKIIAAIEKRPEKYTGRVRELTPALLDTLAGIKITPLDVDRAESLKMYEKQKKLTEIQKQFYQLADPAIAEDKKEKMAEIIFQRMQRVMKEK